MSQLICPKGHASTETDFCSECGIKLGQAQASTAVCPDCQAPHSGEEFCEICGYNFKSGAHGELHPAPPAPPPPTRWELMIEIDPALRTEDSPEPPPSFTPATIHLNPGSVLIGRTSAKRAIHPDVALDSDDAVSHRHALLDVRTDGHLFLRDIGSSNGTMRNGKPLPAMEDIELANGDRIELGHWTRLTVKASS